jgi:hypothetical protein
MGAFYFLYSPLPLFTQVRGRGMLRSSPFTISRKFAKKVSNLVHLGDVLNHTSC